MEGKQKNLWKKRQTDTKEHTINVPFFSSRPNPVNKAQARANKRKRNDVRERDAIVVKTGQNRKLFETVNTRSRQES